LLEQPLGLEAGGGVVARHAILAGVGFLDLRNDQVAVLYRRVDGTVRVVLELVVSPPVAADVVGPLRRVGQRAVCAVELVAPDERPRPRFIRRGGGGRTASAAGERDAQPHRDYKKRARAFHPKSVAIPFHPISMVLFCVVFWSHPAYAPPKLLAKL